MVLVRPPRPTPSGESGTKLSAAGGVVSAQSVARVAQASRFWVEGDHDARFMERVWGDELRELGIVVEPMRGIDDLAAAVAEFQPRAHRRLAILVDHLVPGSKETRIAAKGERSERPYSRPPLRRHLAVRSNSLDGDRRVARSSPRGRVEGRYLSPSRMGVNP